MNILPKKRWHVRNKDNIARVRADEAKAAEEEKQKQERIKLAEREARRELLLEKSRLSKGVTASDIPAKTNEKVEDHVNLFKDLADTKGTNKEHDKRIKEEKEKYEKQIGYLTYLGQDTNEALGKKSWYDVLPDRSDTKAEVNLKSKVREDPLEVMKKHLVLNQPTTSKQIEPTKYSVSYENHEMSQMISRKRKRDYNSEVDNKRKQKKKKKHKNKKRKQSDSEESCSEPEESELKKEKQKKLEMLRAERIQREKEERRRTEELLDKIYGTDNKKDCENPKQKPFKPRYNSQFNPELAKQNYK